MKYTRNERKDDTIKVDFVLSAKEWEEAVEASYKKNKMNYKKEGFRQGKVPRKVLENTYGPYIFYEDAMSDAFSKAYAEMLKKEKDIEPVDYPEITPESADEKGAKFTALIYVAPIFEVKKYTGFKIEKGKTKVTKAEIDAELDSYRNRHARFVEVTDRAVEDGDLVNIDYSGSVNGVKFDGGTAQDQELEIGSKTFIDGFEEQVKGMKIGEEKDLKVKFPENYHSKDLAGKDAVFAVKLLGIRKKELPEINDEFAKEISESSSLQALTLDIEERLSKEKNAKEERLAEQKLVKAITDEVEMKVPEKMIERQLDYFVQELESSLRMQGLTKEMFFEYTSTTEEKYKKERRAQAEDAVKTSLVLESIIEKENLGVTDKDIDAKIEEIAAMYGQPAASIRDMLEKQNSMFSIRQEIMSEKVVKFLKEHNEIV